MSAWVEETIDAASRHLTISAIGNFTDAAVGSSGGGCTGSENHLNLVVPIDESAEASDYVLFPWFVQLVGCCSLFLLTRFDIPVPYAAVIFILGAVMGAVSTNTAPGNSLSNSIAEWVDIDPELLLVVFLPGLLFKEAVETPFNLFVAASGQILIIAYPMVMVGTALLAVAGYYCLPYQYSEEDGEFFGWFAWLTLGTILSATDPIAVASVLKTAGASPRLVMHITGESLLNDGSSYVLFMIFTQLWFKNIGLTEESGTSDITTALTGTVYFLKMAFGGCAVGILFGFALVAVLWQLDRRLERQYDILQPVIGLTAAYLCFYLCDRILEMSGIIAVVSCGLVVNRFARGMINDEERWHGYLELADFLLNTLLFALGGLIWGAISFAGENHVKGSDVGWLIIFYVFMIIVRFFQVGLFYPILSRIGLKTNWKESVFFAWGGMHGSVGVALGLHLFQTIINQTSEDNPRRQAATVLQFIGGGGTLLTLLINGSSAGFVLKKLGLSKPRIPDDHLKHIFEGAAKDFVFTQLTHLLQEPRFNNVSFDVVKEIVPFVTKEPINITQDSQVRRQNHAVSIHRFNNQIAGEGKPYMNLVQATRRASEHGPTIEDNEHHKRELLIEMRQVFLDVLKEAYKSEQECFEIDCKQHDGFLCDVLMQSADLAVNEVRYENKSINDWRHTEVFFRWNRNKRRNPAVSSIGSSPAPQGSGSLRRRTKIAAIPFGTDTSSDAGNENIDSTFSLRSSLRSVVTLDNGTAEKDVAKAKIDGKRLRLDVHRALAFKRGHELAESKLRLYVNRFYDEDDPAMKARHEMTKSILDKVISESREQVRLADELLKEEVDDEDLDIILSHCCARIAICRLADFTKRKGEQGLVGKREARKYLSDFKEKLTEIESRTVDRLAEQRMRKDMNARRQRLSNRALVSAAAAAKAAASMQEECANGDGIVVDEILDTHNADTIRSGN